MSIEKLKARQLELGKRLDIAKTNRARAQANVENAERELRAIAQEMAELGVTPETAADVQEALLEEIDTLLTQVEAKLPRP